MKFKEWLKTKVRSFLGIDKEYKELLELKNAHERLHEDYKNYCCNYLHQRISQTEKDTKVLHTTLESILHIGTDFSNPNYGRSWAVICIEGNINIVKFVDLDRLNAREVLNFLKRYEGGRHCIDTPLKEYFYNDFSISKTD